jgi:hypothetical protein
VAFDERNIPPDAAPDVDDPIRDFGRKSWNVYTGAKIAAAVGLGGALLLGFLKRDAFQRFYFGYLASFAFFLSIALGSLFFVLIQHVTRAGWSVNVRRIAENFAITLPVLGALSAPIFISVVIQDGSLYPWALPIEAAQREHGAAQPDARSEAKKQDQPSASDPKDAAARSPGHSQFPATAAQQPEHVAAGQPGQRVLDELTLEKRPWLNPYFFLIRLVLYFCAWSAIALYYWRQSTQQDLDGDWRRTEAMQKYSAPALLLLGLTLTFGAFDLLMSLDPHWYSTMFGVYFFAGAAVAAFAAMIVVVRLCHAAGFLKQAINVEHYHDLGKLLFGFLFFYGYIAFSQYMLIWYANIPETVTWFARRGASTARPDPALIEQLGSEKAWLQVIPDYGWQWRWWALALLFGGFLIPFAGLMSRHVKRNERLLTFWAVWLLVFHFVDMTWVVLPELRHGFTFHPLDVLCWIGIAGVLTAAWIRFAAHHRLRSIADPRVDESAVFVNV